MTHNAHPHAHKSITATQHFLQSQPVLHHKPHPDPEHVLALHYHAISSSQQDLPPPLRHQPQQPPTDQDMPQPDNTKHSQQTAEPASRSHHITLKPNPLFSSKRTTTTTTPTAPTPPNTDTTIVPVQRRPHNLPLQKFQPPTDPAQLEVFQWINQHARTLKIYNEPMISYVAKVLTAAHLNSTHFTDMQLLTHTKWNDDTNRNEHHTFLMLTIPALASRGDAPTLPPTRREALNIPPIKHVFAAHVSEEGKNNLHS